MDFFTKSKVLIHSIMALSEILDVIIAVVINIITREDFNLLSAHNIIMCGILVFFIAMHIVCGFIIHNSSQKVRNKRFQKAFTDHGGYDLLAEEAKDCIKRGDYGSIKHLKKVAEIVER